MYRTVVALVVAVGFGGAAGAQEAAQTAAPQFSMSDVYTALMDKAPAPCPADKTREQCETVEKTRRWEPARRDGPPPADLIRRTIPLPVVTQPTKQEPVKQQKTGRHAPTTTVALTPERPSANYVPTLSYKDILTTFAVGSAEITVQGRANLDIVAKALREDGRLEDINFEVAGYTDAQGDEAYNQDLSERRAQAVRDYLVSHGGVAKERLTAKGYGKNHLRAPSDPFDEINRRVEMIRTS